MLSHFYLVDVLRFLNRAVVTFGPLLGPPPLAQRLGNRLVRLMEAPALRKDVT